MDRLNKWLDGLDRALGVGQIPGATTGETPPIVGQAFGRMADAWDDVRSDWGSVDKTTFERWDRALRRAREAADPDMFKQEIHGDWEAWRQDRRQNHREKLNTIAETGREQTRVQDVLAPVAAGQVFGGNTVASVGGGANWFSVPHCEIDWGKGTGKQHDYDSLLDRMRSACAPPDAIGDTLVLPMSYLGRIVCHNDGTYGVAGWKGKYGTIEFGDDCMTPFERSL